MQARRLVRLLLLGPLGAGLSLGGCSGPDAAASPPPSYEALVPLDGWSGVARDSDAFITDPDQTPTCVGEGFFIEDTWLEIDTTVCSWVTVQGTSRFAVTPGQELRIVISHFDLAALEPAQGELRLRLGACNAWQKTVSIPHAAEVYREAFPSPCALEKDGVVQFHLHNHGQNNWQLQELSLLR
jgi:hypothetical protein